MMSVGRVKRSSDTRSSPDSRANMNAARDSETTSQFTMPARTNSFLYASLVSGGQPEGQPMKKQAVSGLSMRPSAMRVFITSRANIMMRLPEAALSLR